MVCCVAAYKGLYQNTGDFTEGAVKNRVGLQSLYIITLPVVIYGC